MPLALLLFALTLAGLHLQAKGRTATGGIAIGLAAALSVSPALVVGWSRFLDYVSAWRAMVARGWSVGKMNQSVFAMLDRLIGHGRWAWFDWSE